MLKEQRRLLCTSAGVFDKAALAWSTMAIRRKMKGYMYGISRRPFLRGKISFTSVTSAACLRQLKKSCYLAQEIRGSRLVLRVKIPLR